jgi:GMP synthase (glutamine-hydrolysing)
MLGSKRIPIRARNFGSNPTGRTRRLWPPLQLVAARRSRSAALPGHPLHAAQHRRRRGLAVWHHAFGFRRRDVPRLTAPYYDPDPCVTRQIDFARAAFAAGVPVWGSCWGLQLAVVALGGSVRRNPRGREFARAITITEAGRAHSLLASRPFDALCSHLDEIETLPPDSQVLAANEVSAIQAIVVQTPRRGSFHGTQYHPEHTLAVSAALMQMRAAELVEEGFATEPTKIVAIAADYRALDAEPARRDLIWRYGIASEIMDPVRRTTEIGNWLRAVVVPLRF